MMGNSDDCKEVMATIESYTERLTRFVVIMGPEMIETSEELQATFAREAISKFEQSVLATEGARNAC